MVIMDQMMPAMSGVEALRAMRAEDKFSQTPVLFFTATEDERAHAEAMNLGAQGWLRKGQASLDDILAEVAKAKEN